jgi:hypothetical protein
MTALRTVATRDVGNLAHSYAQFYHAWIRMDWRGVHEHGHNLRDWQDRLDIQVCEPSFLNCAIVQAEGELFPQITVMIARQV